jgi:hypothetical protein
LSLVVIAEPTDLVGLLNDSYVWTGSSRAQFGYTNPISMAAAMRSNSVLNLIAINDYLPIIQEWFATKKEFIIYDNSFIKLAPGTDYYVLYKRGKSVSELKNSELKTFKDLLGINIMLDIYQSDIFSAEGGIKSVSLSGLSVSFNVPDAALKVTTLSKQKENIMSNMAMDYSDGCIGLI